MCVCDTVVRSLSLFSRFHSFTPLPPRQASTYDAITRQTAFNVVAALKKRLRLPSLPRDAPGACPARTALPIVLLLLLRLLLRLLLLLLLLFL